MSRLLGALVWVAMLKLAGKFDNSSLPGCRRGDKRGHLMEKSMETATRVKTALVKLLVGLQSRV